MPLGTTDRLLESMSGDIPVLDVKALQVVTTPEDTYLTLEGYSFEAGVTFTLAQNAVHYIAVRVPAGDTHVGFQSRIFKADLPDVDLEVLWDAGISGGTPVPIFNNHRDSGVLPVLEFLDSPTVDETNAVTREFDFIPSGANNNRTGGQISANTGYRLYSPTETAVVKVTNRRNSTNRIKLAYVWVELP